MIYRIAELADWTAAQQTGFFASADLKTEGFIHASELYQVLGTANRYYAGRQDIVLLELDEAELWVAAVPVQREYAAEHDDYFPHILAPIPLAAVVRALPFALAEEGGHALPPELDELA
ncbi:Uncharacterized conserved protein, DUF952 family [Hymenobacter daecheongensis DSM 21074]|uniref:Uncharacterized conserved protein, DUF952 family n=1 Tax=Hymenobacter daecheongensis DSM 21074 TaxID=1121955 RepID=A0A1M6F2Y3_9BACT|nr:DUF952 domain-containing protein [Hymenobacter daecheongensis]SHI92042.1 Uncharacterized conserved protein, DUF952 family [Hymenobacter daecheongensis DSM 21074]